MKTEVAIVGGGPGGSAAAMFLSQITALEKAELDCQEMPAEGIEPTHPCEYQILSLARLPVPPRRLCSEDMA